MKDNMKRAPFSTQIDLSKFDMKDFAKASDEEKRQQEVMGESTTFLKEMCIRDSFYCFFLIFRDVYWSYADNICFFRNNKYFIKG